MQIGVLGLNYLTANLQTREVLARCAKHVAEDCFFSKHLVCLSTCNRVEFYFSHEDLIGVKNQLIYFLQSQTQEPLFKSMYAYFDLDCFCHLARVTSGLDSAIFGETDIQRQVKKAYYESCHNTPLVSAMHYLFQKSLKIGKLLRRNYGKYAKMPDLNTILYETIQESFSKDPLEIALIGYSKVNRKVLHFLRNQSSYRISLFTRYALEAKTMEEDFSCKVYPWKDLARSLSADVMILAAKRNEPIFSEKHFSKKSEKRTLIFDLSVPRNVDPKLQDHPFLELYNIDQLDQKVRKKQQLIASEITELEELLVSNTKRLREIYHQRRRKGLLLEREKQGLQTGLNVPIYVAGF